MVNMMKITSAEAGFTRGIFPGRFCYKIELNRHGIEMSVDNIVKQAVHFPRVVITGDDPFHQRDDVAKLIKKLKTHNSLITFDVYSTGKIRPVKIGNEENINYIVEVDMRKSGLFSESMDRQTITWFITMGAHFLFPVFNDDDIDRVMFLAREYNISKARIYLCSYKLDMIISKAKIIGCNYVMVAQGGFADEYRTEDK